ncbi:MAG: TldD/PmbA family protein [Pseudobdellovibrionaceae bacterium]|nr:TldD/PmbA family protein [Pseudobdellovibrionaceae bacterium]
MEWKQGRDICFKVLDMARDLGVQQCDVILERGKSFSLNAQQGRIDKSKVTSTQVIGIRVLQDQRAGIAASESLEDTALKLLVKQALDTSRYSSPDPYQAIEQKNAKDLIEIQSSMNHPDSAAVKEKVDLALRLEHEVLAKDKRIRNAPYNGYADGEGEHFYANHLGTFCYQKERSYSCYTSALASEGSTQAMYSGSSVSRTFIGLDPIYCVKQSAETAVHLLSAKAVSTGRYDVIFDIDEWQSLLGAFLGAFSAKAAMEGTAYYRDKLGQSIASTDITIRDCPQYSEGFSYSGFDDEGFVRKDMVLVDKGVMKSMFHNSATARYFKVPNTGHAARGPRGSLGTSSTQLVLDKGRTPVKDLYTGTVLKVISLKGLHSGTNAISGYFSLAVEGLLMRDGRTDQYVKDVTLSGNFYELLQQIQAVGDRLEPSSSFSFFSPQIRFGGLSVAGS